MERNKERVKEIEREIERNKGRVTGNSTKRRDTVEWSVEGRALISRQQVDLFEAKLIASIVLW